MRLFLLITVIFLWTAQDCFSKSISITDTLIPVPKRALDNAMRMRDSFNLSKVENAVQQRIIDTLLLSQTKCDVISRKYDSLDIVNKLSEANYKDQLKKSDYQQIILNGINTDLKGELKRKNLTIIKIGGLSLSIIGTLTYLLIKK